MKTPATRVKDFLTILRNAYNTAFLNGWPLLSTGTRQSSRRPTENDSDMYISNKIFSLFLGLSDSKVKAIIRLTPRTDRNSTYMQASQMEMQYACRRLTRQLVSSSLVMSTAIGSSSSGEKKSRWRGIRGSAVQIKLVQSPSQRAIEKFKKHGTI